MSVVAVVDLEAWHAEQGIVLYAEAADGRQYACKFFTSRIAFASVASLYQNVKLACILVPAGVMESNAACKLKDSQGCPIAPFIISLRGVQ
jgi:hypothetical protein